MTKRMARAGWLVVLVAAAAGCMGGEEAAEDELPFEEDLNAAYEEQQVGGPTSRCSGVVIPDRGPFDKRIALTFDDGPNLSTTPEVLDILRRHDAKATFFVLGSAVTGEAHRELLRRMVREGHIVGNHTRTHVNSTAVSLSTFRSEVNRTRQVLEEVGIQPWFFRFPYGSANCSTVDVVNEYGYRHVGWHIDTADWCFASATGGVGYCAPQTFRYVPTEYRRDYIGYTLSQARSTSGGVLLMHDVHRFTVNHLDELLTRLEEEGFRIVSLGDVHAFPRLNGQEPPPAESTPWVGTPCSSDAQCGYAYGTRNGYCHTFAAAAGEIRGFCALSCAGYCPDHEGAAPTFCVELDNPGVGECVSKAATVNEQCAAIPGTVKAERDRFIGDSSAPANTATVCVPPVAE